MKGSEVHRMQSIYANRCEFCGAHYAAEERTVNQGYTACCKKGVIKLQVFRNDELASETELKKLMIELFDKKHPLSQRFHEHVRKINTTLGFTSTIVKSKQFDYHTRCPPVLIVNGNIVHKLGSIVKSKDEEYPQYMQAYFFEYDKSGKDMRYYFEDRNALGEDMIKLIERIRNLIKRENRFYLSLKTALEKHDEQLESLGYEGAEKEELRSCFTTIITEPDRSVRHTHNAPSCVEVALLTDSDPENINSSTKKVNVTYRKDGKLDLVPFYEASYLPLSYPLFHLFAEGGWHRNILLPLDAAVAKNRVLDKNGNLKEKEKVTVALFAKYILQVRDEKQSPVNNDLILCGGKLLQQYIADLYNIMESDRLEWLRSNQGQLKSEKYENLHERLQRGNAQYSGKYVVLPSSSVGSSRWYVEQFHDAIARARVLGNPFLFITFTCNPNWPEFKESLRKGQSVQDRPDIITRIFHIKFHSLLNDIINGEVFGEVSGYQAVVEWQKRGLPHTHILVYVPTENIPKTVEEYDRFSCAELPDGRTNPKLLELVLTHMIHGPCGEKHKTCPCMRNDKCTKGFPKPFCEATTQKPHCYPELRRRDRLQGGHTAKFKRFKHNYWVDNSWVVPYNPYLLMRYQAHINVEICNSLKAIKYLHKYIYKGGSSALVIQRQMLTGGVYDEIKLHQTLKYFGPAQAAFHLFAYKLSLHDPPVVRLTFHLPGEQSLLFFPGNEVQAVTEGEQTMLMAFFKAVRSEYDNPPTAALLQNGRIPIATQLTYADFPAYFKFEKKEWHRNTKSCNKTKFYTKTSNISRLNWVSPTKGELFYLRILLLKIKGPKSFLELKTVGDTVCKTFLEACQLHGFTERDEEWEECLSEAVFVNVNGHELRSLFSIILVNNNPTNPLDLWNKFKDGLSEDIRYKRGVQLGNRGIEISNEDYDQALHEMQNILMRLSGGNKNLSDFNLPKPTTPPNNGRFKKFFLDSSQVDLMQLQQDLTQNELTMNEGQKQIYRKILNMVLNKDPSRCLFIDAPGGTGKTFVTNCIISKLLLLRKKFVAGAFSGVAATLLTGGKTTHAVFKLPLSADPPVNCGVERDTYHWDYLRGTDVIIIDEAPMLHKSQLEGIHRLLNQVKEINHENTKDSIFGNCIVILSGDFRQTTPVVKKKGRTGIIDALISNSFLWNSFQYMSLTVNERVMKLCKDLDPQKKQECRDFADMLLRIGNGADGAEVTLSKQLIFNSTSIPDFIRWVYPECAQTDGTTQNTDPPPLHKRAILCPKNTHAEEINKVAVLLFKPDTPAMSFKSADKIIEEYKDAEIPPDSFPPEFLNSLNPPNLPPHELLLKPGIPLILLRNLNVGDGLCNGTRLEFIEVRKKYLMRVRIVDGPQAGKIVEIPRIKLFDEASELPFTFSRLQFPVKLAFAMTINKAQGQSLLRVGIYLPDPVFGHGQLYVALSRSGIPHQTKVFIVESLEHETINRKNTDGTATTTNIVWDEILTT